MDLPGAGAGKGMAGNEGCFRRMVLFYGLGERMIAGSRKWMLNKKCFSLGEQ
jgi:hypothetical protein